MDRDNSEIERISVVTFNTRGLRNRIKRRAIFRHIRIKYRHSIAILQETHSTENDENIWKCEWGGLILFSHGTDSCQAGVAILFPVDLPYIPSKVYESNGRVICAKIETRREQDDIIIMGVYGPSVDIQSEKCRFLEELRNLLLSVETQKVFLAGDFNIKLSKLDSDSTNYCCTRASNKLQDILSEFSLEDAWRFKYPATRRYTWRRSNPVQQSRIDHIFTSRSIISNNVAEVRIDTGILSDHSFVSIDMQISSERRGPGIWRYNNLLLDDTSHVNTVRAEIDEAVHNRGIYSETKNKGLKLEMLLSRIRSNALKRSKQLAQETRREERLLYNKANELECIIAKTPTEEQRIEYEKVKTELDYVKEQRGRSAILRSHIAWVEDGEKSTKYFLRMCKTREAQKNICTVINDDGSVVRGNKQILDVCVEHFQKLYASRFNEERNLHNFLAGENVPRLSDNERMGCEGPITKEECKVAIDKMARNKAAGISGFTAEFFSFFWEDIGDFVVDYYNQAKKHGELFITHRRGVITLVPKKGNQMQLKNKRPICLLDVVYKIIAKVIANRLGNVVDKLVHNNQTGFIKGRYIGENLRLISDVIDYCDMDNIEGILMAIDYRNAFDSVEHDFIIHSLKCFNFGPDFISWVRLLYNNVTLTVKNNGHTSRWFSCSRGTFQGSPLSGLLFNLVAEILAIKIRAARNVNGVIINGNEIKLSQYADDTTLFLRDSESVSEVMEILADFRNVSGLEINVQKCNIMWMGPYRHRRDSLCGIKALSKIKILGVWFSASEVCKEDNIAPVLKRMRTTVNEWSQRNLTIKGRIVVTKTLLASQLVYVSLCSSISRVDLREIQGLIMRFIWRGRPPKVAQSTLCQSTAHGGLNAVNVTNFYMALRLTWVTRIMTRTESTWRILLQSRLGKFGLQDALRIRRGKYYIDRLKIPEFYKEILISFQRICQMNPIKDKAEVRMQSLWHSDDIRVDNKPVFSKQMYDAGIKCVNDIVDLNGNIMSFDQIRQKYPHLKTHFLTIQSLATAIPSEWKMIMKQQRHGRQNQSEGTDMTIMIDQRRIELVKCKCSHFYACLTEYRKPTAASRWEHFQIKPECWQTIYELPYKCTSSTRLQSLHFRIVNRYIPTRKYLCTRGIVGSPLCLKCFEVDDLEHFFFECADVKEVWNIVIAELINKFNLGSSFGTFQSVIFGDPAVPPLVNMILLIAKQYIISCKLSSNDTPSEPNAQCLSGIVTKYAQAERLRAQKHDKLEQHNVKWKKLLDENGRAAFK